MTTRADAFVFFGATGDLARKMIVPALYRLVKAGRLDIPSSAWRFRIGTSSVLKQQARESIAARGGTEDGRALEALLKLIRYVDGDYNKPETFHALKAALGDARRPVHYLAVPPHTVSHRGAAIAGPGRWFDPS
jgi:glucose-6-phosphate 1-dehydrogenase